MNYYSDLGLDIGNTVLAASKVIEDPALPEITCQVLRLNKIASGQPPGPACRPTVLTVADKRKGMGLWVGLKPLRAFVWVRENPLAAGAIAAGAVLLIGAIGYSFGRSARKGG